LILAEISNFLEKESLYGKKQLLKLHVLPLIQKLDVNTSFKIRAISVASSSIKACG
jgi:hypothetical protein